MPFPRVKKPTVTAGSRIPKLNTTKTENQVKKNKIITLSDHGVNKTDLSAEHMGYVHEAWSTEQITGSFLFKVQWLHAQHEQVI